MTLAQLFLQSEAAYACVRELGELVRRCCVFCGVCFVRVEMVNQKDLSHWKNVVKGTFLTVLNVS